MLKIKLILLGSFLPLTFISIGFLIGVYVDQMWVGIIAASVGLGLGLLLNYICSYRKLFAVMLYQTPIPLAMFLLSWWISDTFVSSWLALGIGLGGLAIGLWLNKELILPYQFYRINKRILGFLYLFLSIAMVGLFIGIPVFNIVLGVIAGNYLSIRVISYARSGPEIKRNFLQGSIFSATTILSLSLLSGLAALGDFENVAYLFSYYLDFNIEIKQFVYLFLMGSALLAIAQFSLTFFTANTMLSYWNYRRKSGLGE